MTNWECSFNPFCNDHLVKRHEWPSLAVLQITARVLPGLLLTNPLCNISSCCQSLDQSVKYDVSQGGQMLTWFFCGGNYHSAMPIDQQTDFKWQNYNFSLSNKYQIYLSLQRAGLLLHMGWLKKEAFSPQHQVTLICMNTTSPGWILRQHCREEEMSWVFHGQPL